MSAETDIIEQLADYGAWLADRPGVELAVGPRADKAATIEASLDDVDTVDDLTATRSRPRWVPLLAAAAATVAVLCAGLVVARRSSSPADQPTSTTDPPGALYVLPNDDRAVTNPSRESGPLVPHTGLVVGTPDGDSYRDPVTVTASSVAPDRSGGEWQPIALDSGPATVADEPPLDARVVQQRGDHWLTATAKPGESHRAADVLDDVIVDAAGTLSLDPTSPEATITAFTNDLAGVGHTTYLELDGGVVVETASIADPFDLPVLADTVQAVSIDGRPVWHVTDDRGAEGTWHALVWMGTPHRVVAVSGTAPYALVADAARSLDIIGEDEWESRLGIPPAQPTVDAPP